MTAHPIRASAAACAWRRAALPAGAGPRLPLPPGSVAIEAEADTFIRFGRENTTEGADPVLRIRDPANRVLVRFSQAAIEDAVRGRVLESAALRLCIVFNNQQWSRRTPG